MSQEKKCPVCGSGKRSVVHAKENINTTWFQCGGCSLVYQGSGKGGARADEKYYRSGQMREAILCRYGDPGSVTPEAAFEEKYPLQWERFLKVKDLLRSDSSLLEIGCGAGGFLHIVAPRTGDYAGVELDKEMADFCRSRLRLKVHDQLLSEIDFGKKKFDLVCMFHVLEHFADPKSFLAQVKKLLKPSGRLVIEVPCFDEALFQVFPLKKYADLYFTPHHELYFTPSSLERLLVECGFQGELSPFNEYGMENHLNWIQNDSPVPGASRQSGRGLQISSYKKSERNTAFINHLNCWLRDKNVEYKDLLGAYGFHDTIFCVADRD